MNLRTVTLSLLALALSTTSAHAQSSSAEAETLFRQARELMAQKKYAEACAAFDSSQKLDPTATTMYSLAVCRELEGKLATAWGLLIDFERQQRSTTDAALADLRKKASERAKALEPRLSKLTIMVSSDADAADLVVQRNSLASDRGSWGRALPVDGGAHVVAAKRPGFKDWSTTITTKPELDSQTVTIPALEPLPVEPTPAPVVSQPTPVDVVVAPEPRSKIVPIAFAGGALALGGAAIGFELWGRAKYDDAKAILDEDSTRSKELEDGANLRRYLAQGFAVAAVGCAVVSVVLFVRSGSESKDRTALRFVPSVSGEQAGFAVVGGW